MIYKIYYEGKRKFAHPVKNREELMMLRNSPENLAHLAKARQGDQAEKAKLLQLAYNIGHVNGALAGCKSIGSYFFHDVDCYDKEHSEQTKELILQKKEEIGLKGLERSASGGWHLICQRIPGTTILENQVRVASILQLEMDTSAKDLQRVVFSTSGSEEDLPYLDDCLFSEPMTPEECEAEYNHLKVRVWQRKEQVPAGAKKANKHYRPWEEERADGRCKKADGRGKMEVERSQSSHFGAASAKDACINLAESRQNRTESMVNGQSSMVNGQSSIVNGQSSMVNGQSSIVNGQSFPQEYHGIPFSTILKKYWEVNNRGFEPTEGDRDTLTYQLACDLRHICAKNFEWLDQVIPCYEGFPLEEKQQKIKSALNSEYEAFPTRLRKVLDALEGSSTDNEQLRMNNEDDEEQTSMVIRQLSIPAMPLGIRDSIEAVGPHMSMPTLTAICPAIGTLATGVVLDVHGQKKGLNLIAYIAGEFASDKGRIDPVVEAWMGEVRALDKMYQMQEDEWRGRKRAAKNKKEQPEEPKLPVRFLTLNNTVANLAERLANTEGKHAFSFTPEADTVAQKWKTSISDFSIMLRQSYDGSRFEREARSADAVNVHIEHLLWNVTMCGTPDALYRVVNNYTDGFQSRIAVARTPDNTYAPLAEKTFVLTERQEENIRNVAHLLPLMQGTIELPKLEDRGRKWLERIRLETMMNDDKVMARQRFRICVTAQRMTCCLMLCKVCETLIQKHGLNGAETQLKQDPGLWKTLILKTQTPQMLEAFDVIADSLMDNALYFFRERIENAFSSRDYAGSSNGERQRRTRNDSIYERLDPQFTYEQALQQTIIMKGADVSHNSVKQMLKNWRHQGLIVILKKGIYRKCN